MSVVSKIAPGDWITVGKDSSIDAVVSSIRPARVEVVYLDASYKALHKEVKWAGTCWEFVDKAEPGKQADKDPRLERYVGILRAKKECSGNAETRA